MPEDLSDFISDFSLPEVDPESDDIEIQITGSWDVRETQWHVFVCLRNPNVHRGRVPCHERLVICPKCGSAGDMVVVELHSE